MVGLDWI